MDRTSEELRVRATDLSGPHCDQTSCSAGTGPSRSKVTGAEGEADHPSPSKAKVKNVLSHPSTPHTRLHGVQGDKLTFQSHLNIRATCPQLSFINLFAVKSDKDTTTTHFITQLSPTSWHCPPPPVSKFWMRNENFCAVQNS